MAKRPARKAGEVERRVMLNFWDDHEQIYQLAIRISIVSVFFAVVSIVATVIRLEPHARAWFERNKPEWVTEIRAAREKQLLQELRQQEQRQTPKEQP